MRFFQERLTDRIFGTTEEFAKMNICETYDKWGNEIDNEEVGDYDVVALNYFNGQNWQSIIIEGDDVYEEIEGEEAAKLLEAEMEFVFHENGIKISETEDYQIEEWNSSWEEYRFEKK